MYAAPFVPCKRGLGGLAAGANARKEEANFSEVADGKNK